MPDEVSLREHQEQRWADWHARYDSDREGDAKAVEAALAAQEKAVDKALAAADKRFEGVNEFRGQLADQAATLMPRAEADSRFTGMDEKIDARFNALAEKIDDQKNITSKMTGGSETSKWMIGLAFSAGGILVALVTFLLRSKP